jgi:tRNA uridine 5-carboxymethylaminomethyl modification enzyme
MFRPGYAIEYDFFPPTQLDYSLETHHVRHLFFAGQINGTTGYEEAACQGLMAGINAHLKARGHAPLILKRSEAYIGVLIDDLISKGTREPYRMFTSRAEFRTLLRQDNADLRLTRISHEKGLASADRMHLVDQKEKEVQEIRKKLTEFNLTPEEINPFLLTRNSPPISQKQKIHQILLRPGIGLSDMSKHLPQLNHALRSFSSSAVEQAEIQVKYEVYIEKEKELVSRMGQMENLEIPDSFDYQRVQAISAEAKEKLGKVRPRTLGQASRISGINPSDLQILMVYMGR